MHSYHYQPTTVAVPTQPKKAGKCLYITLAIVAVVALLIVGTLVVAVALDAGRSATTVDESTYKASTSAATVTSLDKAGSAGAHAEVSFTCTIGNFVKDSNGMTAVANVNDPSSNSVIQVAFAPGTDITHLNTGDVLEVWGTDQGTASGQNGFGVTIQEVVIHAKYMSDQTTGYTN
jgi:type II secretory pathway pseudopilin PulG